jgi:hypothetical protein
MSREHQPGKIGQGFRGRLDQAVRPVVSGSRFRGDSLCVGRAVPGPRRAGSKLQIRKPACGGLSPRA